LFKVLELTTELRDSEVGKTEEKCQSALPILAKSVAEAANKADRVLARAEVGWEDIKGAAEAGKQARQKESTADEEEASQTRIRIDEAFARREAELSKAFK